MRKIRKSPFTHQPIQDTEFFAVYSGAQRGMGEVRGLTGEPDSYKVIKLTNNASRFTIPSKIREWVEAGEVAITYHPTKKVTEKEEKSKNEKGD